MCRNDGARYAGGSVEPHEPLARGCVVCHHVQGLEPQLSPYICNDDDTDDGDDDDAAWTRLQVPHPSTPEPTSGAGTAAGSRAELLASLAVRGVLALACSLSLSILTRARSLALAHIHSRNRSFASISKGSMPSSRRCSCPRTTPSSSSITRSPRSVCLRTRQALVCASCISMRCWTIAPHVRYLFSLSRARCLKLYQECSGTPTEPRTYIAREIHTELTSSVAMAANSMQLLPTCLACRCEPTRTCSNCTTRPSRKDTKSSLCSSCCRRQKSSIFHPVYVSMLRARALSLSHVLVH